MQLVSSEGKRPHRLLAAAMAWGTVIGCGDPTTDPGPPPPSPFGTLEIVASTQGSDFDADGYSLAIGGIGDTIIGPNDTLRYDSLPSSTTEILVSGVEINCVMASPNPRSVTIRTGATAREQLAFACIQKRVPSLTESMAFFCQTGVNGFNPDICVWHPGADEPVRLTTHPEWDSDPTWSPDGARIAFTSGRDGNREIYAINIDGTGLTNLTNTDDGSEEWPDWSPDGTQIAFSAVTPDGSDLYLMNADGTGRVNLTNDSISFEMHPDWSPDGTRITFASIDDPIHGIGFNVFVINADGTGLTQLTDEDFTNARPSWSPDAQRIAFTTERSGDPDVWVMGADGSNQTNLTRTPTGFEETPVWSADGTEIFFAANRDGGFQIYVMNADGTAQRQLLYTVSHSAKPAFAGR